MDFGVKRLSASDVLDGRTKLLDRTAIQYTVLAAIILLAAALRLYKLGEWGFWIDEIYTIQRAQQIFDLPSSSVPPANSLYAVHYALELLGVNEWSARIVSVIVALLSMPLFYFAIKRIFGTAVGLLSILLLAVAPWHIMWSQNARFYIPLMTLYSLALLAFYFGLERDRLGYILLSLLLLILAAHERLTAFHLVPVMVGYLLALKVLPFEKPAGFRLRTLSPVLLLFGVGALGFLVDVGRILVTGDGLLLELFGRFLGRPVDDPFRLLSYMVFSIGVPLATMAFFGGVYVVMERNRAGLLFFLGIVIPVLASLTTSLFMFTKERYIFATLLCWIVLAAVAIHALFSQLNRRTSLLGAAVLMVLLADAAGDNILYYQVNNGNRLDWKTAFALVESQRLGGDEVATTRADVAEFYLEDSVEVIPLETLNRESAAKIEERTWFVVDSEVIWTQRLLKEWLEENARLVEVYYLRVPENLHLRVYLYEPTATER